MAVYSSRSQIERVVNKKLWSRYVYRRREVWRHISVPSTQVPEHLLLDVRDSVFEHDLNNAFVYEP